MKLLNGTFTNFGSYEAITFDFENIGLGLVYGKTGSGKSTIPDMAAWALFGVTAKDGAADDVKSWTGDGEPTTAQIDVETPTGIITVHRIRGTGKQNDLFWFEPDNFDTMNRGKDITETQKLLEARLGVTSDLFLTGSYFHEFSKTGTFFAAKAKDRRAVFEEIADLSLPVRLALAASTTRKAAKIDLDKALLSKTKAEGRLEQLEESVGRAEFDSTAWASKQASAILVLEQRSKSFEQDKAAKIRQLSDDMAAWEEEKSKKLDILVASLEALEKTLKDPDFYTRAQAKLDKQAKSAKSAKCKECDQPLISSDAKATFDKESRAILSEQLKNDRARMKFESDKDLLEAVAASVNPFNAQVEAASIVQNYYSEQIRTEKEKINPFSGQLLKFKDEIINSEGLVKGLIDTTATLEQRLSALDQLYDLSSDLRGELLKKAVKEAESETNRVLETYFDAEIRVEFSLTGADSLDIGIQKGGHECVYKQLSKGQRQLLKLSFVLAVQRAAANKAGIHLDNLFFDEALDGLDAEMKVAAFGLFEELASRHGSVLLIDHAPEFQNLFSKRYYVTLEGDHSTIEIEE